MDDAYIGLLSKARFAPYVAAADGDRAEALHLYRWNQEACAAFLHVLGEFEVLLRNAMHAQLGATFKRPDWWEATWKELRRRDQDQIDDAESERKKRYRARQVTPDCVVSGLTLAFWVGLVSKRDNYEMTLWRPALRHVFHGYKGGPSLLYDKLDSVRLLRNRVSHHEPIFHRHLELDHEKIVSILRLISAEAAATVANTSPVPAVLQRRPCGKRR